MTADDYEDFVAELAERDRGEDNAHAQIERGYELDDLARARGNLKPLDKLGISPAPWKVVHQFDVEAVDGTTVKTVELSPNTDGDTRNTRLIAAAPELYECLRTAVIEMCHDCPNCSCHERDGECYECAERPDHCFVQEWRAALAKAAGEEVTE